MSYSSNWNKAAEYANKRWYEFFTDNEISKHILSQLSLKVPYNNSLKEEVEKHLFDLNISKENKIKTIVSADWWYTISEVSHNTQISFIKFGLYYFDLNKLDEINKKETFSNKEYNELGYSEVIWLPYPISNLHISGFTKKETLYKILWDFLEKETLFETLHFLFNEKYLNKEELFYTNEEILEKIGFVFSKDANQELSYILSVIEQLLLLKKIIDYYSNDKEKLKETLFIRDWFLWFLGSEYKENGLLYKVEKFINFLINSNEEFYLIGIEKSGSFSRFANYINELELIWKNKILLPNNTFVSKNIVSSDYTKNNNEYVKNKYYAWKTICKIWKNLLIVNFPIKNSILLNNSEIWKNDFNQIDTICSVLNKVKTMYYENWVIPIILINKDVSVSQSSEKELKKLTIKYLKK